MCLQLGDCYHSSRSSHCFVPLSAKESQPVGSLPDHSWRGTSLDMYSLHRLPGMTVISPRIPRNHLWVRVSYCQSLVVLKPLAPLSLLHYVDVSVSSVGACFQVCLTCCSDYSWVDAAKHMNIAFPNPHLNCDPMKALLDSLSLVLLTSGYSVISLFQRSTRYRLIALHQNLYSFQQCP